MTLDLCQVNGCRVLVLNHKKLTYFKVMRVFIDMGQKPSKEGKNAPVVLSMFTHITIEIYQQIPLGSDAVNKELTLMVMEVPSYVDRDQSTNGSRPKALRKASNFALGRMQSIVVKNLKIRNAPIR